MLDNVPMQLLVASDATSADLHIMGNITSGSLWFGKAETDTDASDIAQALADLPDTCTQITVHVNSMGGDVAQGIAIYNALKAARQHVTTVCEGFACSIASVVFMAGQERIMRNASLLMVHEAWIRTQGDAKELRKTADNLETITELSKRAYMEHATDALTREMLDQLMADETWILPEQALEWGLATKVDATEGDKQPEQSAMLALMRRLTEPRGELLVAEVSAFDVSEQSVRQIADSVIHALEQMQSKPDPEPEPEPETEPEPEPEQQAMSFFQRAALMFAD